VFWSQLFSYLGKKTEFDVFQENNGRNRVKLTGGTKGHPDIFFEDANDASINPIDDIRDVGDDGITNVADDINNDANDKNKKIRKRKRNRKRKSK
jgi:hypothetical protein